MNEQDEKKAKDIAWNFATGIPGLGTLLAGHAAIDDLSRASNAKTDEERSAANRSAASNALSAIPGLGTALSVGGIAYDILAPNDTAGELMDRVLGGKPQAEVDERGMGLPPRDFGDVDTWGKERDLGDVDSWPENAAPAAAPAPAAPQYPETEDGWQP